MNNRVTNYVIDHDNDDNDNDGNDRRRETISLMDNHDNRSTEPLSSFTPPSPLSPSFYQTSNHDDDDDDDNRHNVYGTDRDTDSDTDKDADIPALLRRLLHRIFQRIPGPVRCPKRPVPRSGFGCTYSYRDLCRDRSHLRTGVRTAVLRGADSRRAPSQKTFGLLALALLLLSALNRSPADTPAAAGNRAELQSYGLFHGSPPASAISPRSWESMARRVRTSAPHRYADVNAWIDEPNVWYHNNWNADFTCPSAERVGGVVSNGGGAEAGGGGGEGDRPGLGWLGDGPKWVCDPRSIVQMVRRRMEGGSKTGNTNGKRFFHRTAGGGRTRGAGPEKTTDPSPPTNGCLIYSIGVNGQELEFEHSIQKLLTHEAARSDNGSPGGGPEGPGGSGGGSGSAPPFCEIHVFDPDGWHEKLAVGEGVHYHDWGIVHRNSGTRSGADNNAPVFKTFRDTVKELGHVGHAVDIMKVDCKLCEWDIYQDWFDHGGGKGHDGSGEGGGGGDGAVEEAGLHIIHQLLVEVHGTPQRSVNAFFDKMRDENYVIFHKEPNTQTFGGTCQDYAFLRLAPEFFDDR